jgi:hypothetical protein
MTLIWDRNTEGKLVPVGRAQLRDAQEIAREVSRSGGRQIVFREGDDPLVLKRFHYDEAFPKDAFNPDPDHNTAPLPLWQRVRLPWTPLPPPSYIKQLTKPIAPATAPVVQKPEARPVPLVTPVEVESPAKVKIPVRDLALAPLEAGLLPPPKQAPIKVRVPDFSLVPIEQPTARATKDRGSEGR